jgi:hypothetical protein
MNSFQFPNQVKQAFGGNNNSSFGGGSFFGGQTSNNNKFQPNKNRFNNNKNYQMRSFSGGGQNRQNKPANSEVYRCEFCSVGSMTKFCYEQHCASQKHIKKQAALNMATTPSAAAPVLQTNVKSDAANASSSAQQQHATTALSLKEINLSEIKQSEPMTQINEANKPSPQPLMNIEQDNSPATSQPKQQQNPTVPKPIPNSNYTCEICKIDSMSKSAYDMHLVGQKHRKTLTAFGITPEPLAQNITSTSSILASNTSIDLTNPPFIKQMGSMMRCELCEVSLHTNDQFNCHLTGRKHHKKVLQYVAVEQARANSTLVDQSRALDN